MMWRRLCLVGVVGCAFLKTGCASDGPQLEEECVARLQKPESPVPPRTRPNYLDMLPDQPDGAATGEVAARIRATVNGVPIFDEEVQANAFQFIAMTAGLPEPERTRKRREIYKEVLDQLIDRELLLQDAATRLKKGASSVMGKMQEGAEKEFDRRWVRSMKDRNPAIKSDDDLKDFLRAQGLSLEMVRRQWTRQFICTEYLRNRAGIPRVTREDMLDYYEQHPEEFKRDDSVDWQDIFLSSVAGGKYKSQEEARKVAEQIVARARGGEDFVALCKQFDDGNYHSQNGTGDGHKRGEIQPPDCEEPLFRMKPGDVGLLEIGTGFHVYKLVKRDLAGRRPFDEEAQELIQRKLRGAKFELEVKNIVAELRKKALIDYSRSAR